MAGKKGRERVLDRKNGSSFLRQQAEREGRGMLGGVPTTGSQHSLLRSHGSLRNFGQGILTDHQSQKTW